MWAQKAGWRWGTGKRMGVPVRRRWLYLAIDAMARQADSKSGVVRDGTMCGWLVGASGHCLRRWRGWACLDR